MINGYDFDKTIYDGDCTVDFFIYMNLTRPYLLLFFPWYLILFICYGLKIVGKKRFKELLFFFVPWHKKNINKLVDKIWSKNANKIKDWYSLQITNEDIIVSASLKFIIEPIANHFKVGCLIATDYDVNTGKISGGNCYGEHKVVKFKAIYGDLKLSAFYSDSLSDAPMMRLSEKSYLVDKNKITDITEQINSQK